MGVIWQKVWFDLWHNKIRTLLAVLSIAFGVFLVGSMFGMADQLLSGMDHAHQSVMPSHVSMYFDKPVDRDTILALRKVPGVVDVEAANYVTARYKIHPEDDWKLGVFVSRDDYAGQMYDIVQLKEGPWPRGARLGIERLSSQYFKAGIGDTVIIEINKEEHTFPIVSKIRHPFVPPPQFGGQAYFFLDAEGMERFGVPQGQFGEVLLRVEPYSPDYAKEVASAVKDRLNKQHIEVAQTFYQDPNKHWGRMFVEGITLVLQVLAVVALLLSVVLVFNTITAIVTQQTNQIGVLKALGSDSGTIARIYLAGIFAYGLLALVIALPLGMFLAFTMTSWFLNLFNIDYSTFTFSRQAVLFQVGAALVVPLIAGLIPVLHGASITVREAIASYGLGADFGSTWIDRAVETIGRRLLPSHYAMALGNTFRRKGRLVLTLLVMVIAGTMFLLVLNLSSSITATLDTEFGRRVYNISVQFEQTQRIDKAVEIARSVPGVTNAAVWFFQPVRILRQGQRLKEAGENTNIAGVSFDPLMYGPPIVAGRWLQPDDGRVIVMNKETADKSYINLGDTVTLDMGQLGKIDWQVVGFYKLVFGGGFGNDTIYATLPALLEATGKGPRGGQLWASSTGRTLKEQQDIATQLEDTYRAQNMKPFYTTTTASDRQSADGQFSIFVTFLLVLAIMVAVVGGIGLMGALSISVIERTKEIGVLRAIGARSPTIMRMFMLEGLVQGLLSWAMAVPLSAIVSPALAAILGRTMFATELDFRYNYQAVLIWLVVVIVIGALASILPARNATRVSVRQSLAYE
jgi:putative ABC transport system permease protein